MLANFPVDHFAEAVETVAFGQPSTPGSRMSVPRRFEEFPRIARIVRRYDYCPRLLSTSWRAVSLECPFQRSGPARQSHWNACAVATRKQSASMQASSGGYPERSPHGGAADCRLAQGRPPSEHMYRDRSRSRKSVTIPDRCGSIQRQFRNQARSRKSVSIPDRCVLAHTALYRLIARRSWSRSFRSR